MHGLNYKILKIILFLIFLLVSDRFIGIFLEKLYNKSNDINISKIRYTLNDTHEDILIFGSSRAQHHYVPETISRITGHNSYNCGLGGQGIKFSFIQISETLKRYKPLRIIFDISPNILLDKNSDQKLNILTPYYHDHSLVQNILNSNSSFEKLKCTSFIYPYNGLLFDLLTSLVYTPDVSIKGYIPIYGTIDTTKIENEDHGIVQDIPSDQMEFMQKIIDICQSYKVELWILVSPVYKKTKDDSKIIHDLGDFLLQQHVHFIDFTKNSDISGYMLFKDNLHLNYSGAIKYSKIVADSIARSLR
jgi:hypothetical protein